MIGIPKIRNVWEPIEGSVDGQKLTFVELLAPADGVKDKRYTIVIHENEHGLVWEVEF